MLSDSDKNLGYSSRMWGLTVDTIVGLDVILANGSFVHASQTEYPDIYWVRIRHLPATPDANISLGSSRRSG